MIPKINLSLIIVLVFEIGCTQPPAATNSSPSTPNTAATSTSSAPSTPAASPEQEARRKKRVAELKSHFVTTVDEFNHTTTVRHKAFSKYINGNGTTIAPDIFDGNLSVQSQLVAQDWIFHEEFIVKIGSETRSASGRKQQEVVDGVCETVSPGFSDSGSIARFIASADNQPVRVRLVGKFYKDYTLRPVHQKAIAETVEYYDLTKSN